MLTPRSFARFLIVAAIFGFVLGQAWISTRKPVFIARTVPLHPGRILFDEFPVNFTTDYQLGIEPEEALPGEMTIIEAQWALLCDGRVEDTGEVAGYAGRWAFLGEPVGVSTCRLQLDLHSVIGQAKQARVNFQGGHYRLETLSRTLYVTISALALFGCFLWVAAETKVSRVLRPSTYGLLGAMILTPITLISTLPGSEPHRSFGLWLKRPSVERLAPLVLRIDRESRWTLNGKATSKELLPAMLRESLRHHPDLVVTLIGDPNIEAGVVLHALDWLQGLGLSTELR